MGEDGCSIPSSPIDFDISSFFFFFFFASPINGVVLLSIAFAPLLSAVLFPAEVSICHHRE